jgi:MFS family permease
MMDICFLVNFSIEPLRRMMSNRARKATLLSSLGAGLEYYDFIIYGMMAEQLSTLFFASSDSWLALIKAFTVFAIGYLVRPIGGILFGMVGDTFGRKKVFLWIMMLMASSTFAIGLLPTYAQIGSIATYLLIAMRLLQGLSYGAELPGAITIVCEYTEDAKQSTNSGIVISSVTLGSILASFILYLISKEISPEALLSWGWRVPFLLGGSLAFANYFIRRHLQETPEFSRLQEKCPTRNITEPFKHLIQNHLKNIAIGMGMMWLSSSLVIFTLYLPAYLMEHFAYAADEIYLAITCGLIWSALILPFCGSVSDYIGRKQTLALASFAFVCGGILFFNGLHQASFTALLMLILFYQTINAFLITSYLPILAGLFPTANRYTGVAACYNLTYSVMGCLPLALTALIKGMNSPDIVIWVLIINALISTSSALGIRYIRSWA